MSMPEAPPPAPAKKKGLHPLVWVAIGCGGLILLILIGMFAAGAFVVHKAKGWVEKAEANPALAAAEMVVRMNPELELVAKDADAGTMTIRNKKDGETITLSFDEIAKGNFSFEKDGERTEIRFQKDDEGGTLRIEGPDGEMVFGANVDRENLPGWVPLYPGATFEGQGFMKTGDAVRGAFVQKSTASPQEVAAFYRERFSELSIPVQTITSDSDEGGEMIWLNGSEGERSLSVHVGKDEEGKTAIQVSFTGTP